MPDISTRFALVAHGVTAGYINELAGPRHAGANTVAPKRRAVPRRIRGDHAHRQPAGLTVRSSRDGRAASWYSALRAITPAVCTD